MPKEKNKLPKWVKGTKEGKLYLDTKDPDLFEEFKKLVKKGDKYKIVNGQLVRK